MKKIFIIALLFFVFGNVNAQKKSKDHARFVGSWAGSEENLQIDGISKHWIMNRYADGTFILVYTVLENCKVRHSVEKGTWYIKNGLFYEKHQYDNKTDIYYYQLLEDNQIHFKAKYLSIDPENTDYEFTDTKINSSF